MNYQIMKAKTHERVLNANDSVNIFKHPTNKKQLKIFEDEFDYFETVESMFNRFEYSLERWLELLESDGINSKNMVATDIQQLLEEIGK